MPLRGISGRYTASSVRIMSADAMKPKKIAVSQVQAIQTNLVAISSQPLAIVSIIRTPPLDAPKGKALGDVIAHEPDHDGARDHGEDAGGGEQRPVHAR